MPRNAHQHHRGTATADAIAPAGCRRTGRRRNVEGRQFVAGKRRRCQAGGNDETGQTNEVKDRTLRESVENMADPPMVRKSGEWQGSLVPVATDRVGISFVVVLSPRVAFEQCVRRHRIGLTTGPVGRLDPRP